MLFEYPPYDSSDKTFKLIAAWINVLALGVALSMFNVGCADNINSPAKLRSEWSHYTICIFSILLTHCCFAARRNDFVCMEITPKTS